MSESTERPVSLELSRLPGDGWLALLGGGEFSFGETAEADEAWLEHTPEGPIGFVPAASGSTDYGSHLATYFDQTFGRRLATVPVYRVRDARRAKNSRRLDELAAIYLGGGVVDHLTEAIVETPFAEAMARRLGAGTTVVAIAAAAQALGTVARGLRGDPVPGLGWLPGGVVEANFDPGHDRRLRELMRSPGVRWGIGVPAGGAALLGPAGEVEVVGPVFALDDWDADFTVLGE